MRQKILCHRKNPGARIKGTLYKVCAMGDHFTRLLDDRINWTGMLNMVRRKNTDNILIYDIVCQQAAYMVDGALILLQSMIQSRRRAWHVNPRAGASYPPHLSYLTHRHHCPASYALFVGGSGLHYLLLSKLHTIVIWYLFDKYCKIVWNWTTEYIL